MFISKSINKLPKFFRSRFFANESKKGEAPSCVPLERPTISGSKMDVCIYSPPESTLIEKCQPDPVHPESIPPEQLPLPSPLSARVIVIGAGISGLTAAQRLVKAGVTNTIVLEASSRPGGRIRTGYIGGNVVEIGGYCKGAAGQKSDNPLASLASRQGFGKISNDLQSVVGTSLPLSIAFGAFKEFMEITEEIECIRLGSTSNDLNLLNDYYGVRIHQVLKKVPEMYIEAATLALTALSSTKNEQNIVINNLGAHLTVAGGIKVPLGTMGMLSNHLKLIGNRILYNKRVDKIRWGTVVQDQQPRAVVRCNDGTSYVADYVLVTLPLGFLKENWESLFSPQLPSPKVEAFKNMTFFGREKIYAEWAQPMWIWREKPFVKSWEPDVLESRNDWTKGLVSAKEVQGSKNLIEYIVDGPATVEMIRSTDQEVMETINNFMQEQIGDTKIPKLKAIMRSNWGDNPLFRGSYPLPSQDSNNARILSEPVPQDASDSPVLYFAGDATSSKCCGEVRGAILSGYREAEKILDDIKSSPEVSNVCLQKCCIPISQSFSCS